MAASIKNQATVTYAYGSSTAVAVSNVASTVVEGPLTFTKRSLEPSYRAGDVLTYILTVKNTGSTALSGLTVVDNLGTYALNPSVNVTPLSYQGPAQLYTNGTYTSALTPVVNASSVTFSLAGIAGLATEMIIYKVKVNEYAGLTAGTSQIVNEAELTAAGSSVPVTAENTVQAAAYALVDIEKTMEPNPVVGGSPLTYTFTIRNYGNQAADDLVLEDVFDPANLPSGLTVTIDGAPFDEFSYTEGVLTIAGTGTGFEFSVPAAAITQDPGTGIVAVEPAVKTVVVTGTI